MKKLTGMLILALLGSACSSSQTAPQVPIDPAPEPVDVAQPTEPAEPVETEEERAAREQAEAEAAAAAEAKRQEAERVAQALAQAEADAAKEAERWTDALRKQAVAMRDKKHKTPKAALTAILKGKHRVPGNEARDKYRHPVQTLTFFGIKPTMTVVEFGAGGGWYTEILAPFLARQGKLVVTSYDPEGPRDSMMTVYGARLAMFLAKSPELYGEVDVAVINPPDQIDLGIDGQADLVLVIREMHGWHRRGGVEPWLKAAHAALKDGGTLGIVAHRAPEGANVEESVQKGYLPEQWVIEQVQAAGFRLVEKSEVNANPKDTKDHPSGVWSLPPALREGETDREKYQAIGESDRMTLKFAKVAQPE